MRWVFRKKVNANCGIPHKARRLVVCGYSQLKAKISSTPTDSVARLFSVHANCTSIASETESAQHWHQNSLSPRPDWCRCQLWDSRWDLWILGRQGRSNRRPCAPTSASHLRPKAGRLHVRLAVNLREIFEVVVWLQTMPNWPMWLCEDNQRTSVDCSDLRWWHHHCTSIKRRSKLAPWASRKTPQIPRRRRTCVGCGNGWM